MALKRTNDDKALLTFAQRATQLWTARERADVDDNLFKLLSIILHIELRVGWQKIKVSWGRG
jgi:hypothetical protein